MIARIDQNAIKSGQAMTGLLLIAAFLVDSAALAGVVGAANLLGALAPRLSAFGVLYRRLLVPLAVVEPAEIDGEPAPHRFAQGFSGVVTLLAAALVTAGITAGWMLGWLVVVLATLNVFAGFCAGCFTYYQLRLLGVPGFAASRR